jgi:hypothetical protein
MVGDNNNSVKIGAVGLSSRPTVPNLLSNFYGLMAYKDSPRVQPIIGYTDITDTDTDTDKRYCYRLTDNHIGIGLI